MAARKKTAKKAGARRKVHQVEEEKPVAAEPTDPRPAAWLAVLEAYAKGEPIPKHCRIHLDDRFTGKGRKLQVEALRAIDIEPEEAAKKILAAAMEEHRGEKHCNW